MGSLPRCAIILGLALLSPAAHAADTPLYRATHSALLAITHAGPRLVAAGDRGTILLSDDQGESWRIAPTNSPALLTALLFTTPQQGWAVGQDSTILHTDDGGAHWVQQTTSPGSDQALFSIAALSPNHLIATGAYALVLETADAGAHWAPTKLPSLDEDYHLNCVQPDGSDVMITGESGHAFTRHAGIWAAQPLPYEGSQFGCLTTQNGTIYSFGLRGSLFMATPTAPFWKRLDTGEQRAIFGGAVLADGHLALVGSNGLLMDFNPATAKAQLLPAPSSATFSGIAETSSGKWALVGDDGVHLYNPHAAASEVTQ